MGPPAISLFRPHSTDSVFSIFFHANALCHIVVHFSLSSITLWIVVSDGFVIQRDTPFSLGHIVLFLKWWSLQWMTWLTIIKARHTILVWVSNGLRFYTYLLNTKLHRHNNNYRTECKKETKTHMALGSLRLICCFLPVSPICRISNTLSCDESIYVAHYNTITYNLANVATSISVFYELSRVDFVQIISCFHHCKKTRSLNMCSYKLAIIDWTWYSN